VRTEYLSDAVVGRAVGIRKTSDEQFRLQLTPKVNVSSLTDGYSSWFGIYRTWVKPGSRDHNIVRPRLRQRPEHSETKAKTETGKCKTETKMKIETKKTVMRPRPKSMRPRPRTV